MLKKWYLFRAIEAEQCEYFEGFSTTKFDMSNHFFLYLTFTSFVDVVFQRNNKHPRYPVQDSGLKLLFDSKLPVYFNGSTIIG